jgi:hypothetical protein
MAFSGNYICTSFKVQLLKGVHNFTPVTGNTFKLALYNELATLDASTTTYTATNEIAASGTYTTGGVALTPYIPTSANTTAYVDFVDLSLTGVTITTYGALIYNSSAAGNPAVCVLDFGGARTTTAGGVLNIVFPTDDITSAIIRVY